MSSDIAVIKEFAESGISIPARMAIELLNRLEVAERERNQAHGVIAAVVSEIPHRDSRNGNAPGHSHSVPGVWDYDNGALAGKKCGWCAVWQEAEKIAESRGKP
ncbi:hypothetical protein ELY33_17025 [Vreelandella andesensis]|uniref:Uncharacterized protein n=1 Tax=Vreelandella andesensis TaxID=447567 RepID=A0A433KEY4_9GAMM|nr:hypothetical protein [Halomonas andesensis]RUR26810.1 hypothetical protein ELY33_17025 [Halomonas andesensis]